MSLITTCPECATSFHVKPEHLSAHRGDVRCGKCALVFNALDKLTETPDLPPSVEPVLIEIEEILVPEPAVEITPESFIEAPADKESPIDEPFIIIEPEAEVSVIVEETPQNIDADEEGHLEPHVITEDLIEAEPVFIVPMSSEEMREASVADSEPVNIDETRIRSSIDEAPKNFLDAAPKGKLNSSTKAKFPKGLLITLIVFLVLAGLTQAIYHLRSSIALNLPVLKPYLVSACSHIGCKIELPKDANLLLVDDSNLQEDADHAGVIHLTSTLINNAEFVQAYPLLELTLTDASDNPLLRRTFKPTEYLAVGTNINDGIPAGEEVHIKLSLTATDATVSGYKIFITY